MSVMTTAEVVGYMARVEVVREAFARLSRGAQQEAAFDLRVSPSLVSAILRGRVVDSPRLEQLSEWVGTRLAEVPVVTPDDQEAAAG